MDKNDEPYVNPLLEEAFAEKSKRKIKSPVRTSSSTINTYAHKKAGATRLKPPASNKKLTESTAYRIVLLAFVCIVCIFVFTPLHDVIPEKISESSASPAIKEIAANAGFNLKGKLLFYRANPELVNADNLDNKCPNDETSIEFGCYLPSENKIYILEVPDPTFKEIEYTTAAHETLLAAWHNLSDGERANITGLIKQIYDNKASTIGSQLTDELKPYGDDQAVVFNELHSFIGSEYDVSGVNQQLSDYYKKYFSNQLQPVSANQQFNSAIDGKNTSLDAEYAQIDNLNNTIDTYKAEHLDNIEKALAYDQYLGDYYTYNINVDRYNQNLVYYNNQVDLEKGQIASYNSDVASFNAVLKAFYPTRTQVKLFTQ